MTGRPRLGSTGAPKRKLQQAKSKANRQEADSSSDSINGIRAMLVGLSVLQAVARERRPLPLRDVAAASGLTPSRVHRYLSSLVAANFIEQDSSSGEYSLGQSVVELGLLALGQLDSIQIGTDALVEFSERTGFDGHLSVWGTFGPTVVRWQSGRLGYHFRIEEGRVLPLLWSATGRILMAYRDFKDVASLVKQEITAWNREHSERQIDREEVVEMCTAVRRHGLSSSVPSHKLDKLFGPVFPRMYRLALETTAVPIFDHMGRVPMALTFFGADDGPSINEDAELQKELRLAAQKASRRLGAG
ncbi:IclR family transcriptional regulator [Bradyrhizobium macuxiense]|uniref:IclR family transcriptional regulator n=1 Tax=Bradyrhizobium macuxiense TaxID=1755647 RepID=A0A560KXH5_9BRAD|nr:IclR family transcriptional regulator [Bradyrhizobium macuxiense]TWB87819.1 IclR family transcriptional regulator [Bradyrhizobium macuxiense]